MSKPILAGYDPRSGDRAPVRFGVAVARLTGAPLIVISVQRVPGSSQNDGDLLVDCADAVERLEAELRAGGLEVECHKMESTSAARALQKAAEQEGAGLLVVGSSKDSSLGRVLAGTTALRLLHGAPCPVAVAPQGWAPSGDPQVIGVAYVDSPDGRAALQGAHALARRIGAKLRVITVVKHHETWHLETDPPIPTILDKREVVDVEGEYRLDAERELRTELEKLVGDVPMEVEAVVGDPAEVIADFSKGVDLLVCGSRGYGPARAVLLGSVSRRVVDAVHCPVIVLPRGVEEALEALLAEAPGAAAPA
jgi:nucleotide-binding universal stress UspA family protein